MTSVTLDLPPLPLGIEVPDTVEELVGGYWTPYELALYVAQRRWFRKTRQEIARERLSITHLPRPGETVSGMAVFRGPLEPANSWAVLYEGTPLWQRDHASATPRLLRQDSLRFEVFLRGEAA